MVDTKISALPAAATFDGTELVPVVQAATSKQSSLSALLGSPYSLGVAVGEWLLDPATGTSNYTQAEAEIDLLPHYLSAGTYDSAAVNIATAGSAGCVCRLLVYSSVNGAPSTLLAASAAVAATTAAALVVTLGSTFTVPPPGAIVWAGAVTQGAASTRAIYTRATTATIASRLGVTPVAGDFSNVNPTNHYATGITGTPPSTWTSTLRANSGARMAFRRSA